VAACLLVAYLIAAGFSAWTLWNHDYETEYLALGNLVVRGQLDLYQDEMRGQWVPLPFYVYGLSQVLAGPSLLAGRLLSIGLGAAVLALVFGLAARWGGPAAGAAAAALFCTHGLVMGYFATVHFAGLVALLHLLAIHLLFPRAGPGRDLGAMAVVSLLFLVKPNFWLSIPFVLAFTLWRARSARRRLALVLVALALPAAFFAWDARHLKLLAYVPVLRDWVEPLGYRSWYSLTEDAGQVAASDYAAIPWAMSAAGRLGAVAMSLVFLIERYAAWFGALAGLLVLAALGARRAGRSRAPVPAGLRFTAALYAFVVAYQYLVMGPYAKQVVGFLGAVAPLLAVVVGWAFGTALGAAGGRAVARLAVAMLALAVIASPWLHRSHNLPRRLAGEGPIATAGRVAGRLAAAIPPGETRVFSMADAMAVHLAGRRSYLQQFNQERFVFTSLADPARYRRVGMWGPSELEDWLARDARYALLQDDLVAFYRRRPPYQPILARMDQLLAQRFTLVEELGVRPGDRLRIYRRRDVAAARGEAGR
jgi:hypothetical protein